MKRKRRNTLRCPNHAYMRGWFFITICINKRRPLLSSIETGGHVVLTPVGQMVHDQWLRLKRHPFLHLDAFIIMPDHFHAIIALIKARMEFSQRHMQRIDPGSVSALMRGFKAGSTRRFRRSFPHVAKETNGILWQRNFHDRIIHNAQQLHWTRRYVRNNPNAWLKRRGLD